MHGGGGVGSEEEGESQTDSLLSVDRNMGLELMTLRSRPEVRSRVWRLMDWATQAPLEFSISNWKSLFNNLEKKSNTILKVKNDSNYASSTFTNS